MIPFALLTGLAVLSKLLGATVYTPLTVGIAAGLFLVRYGLKDAYRPHIDAFLLHFGVLTYALANRDPSYYEQASLIFCLSPSFAQWRRIGQLAKTEGTCLLLLAYMVWSCVWSSNLGMTLSGIIMSAVCLGFIFAYVVTLQGDLRRILHHILLVLGVLAVSAILVGAMGHGFVGRFFVGATLHRNQFGLLIGLLILIGLLFIRYRPVLLRCLLVLSGLSLMAYVDSKSAIISLTLTSALWLIANSTHWRLWSSLVVLAALTVFLMLPSPKMDHFALWMGRDPTFSSRTEIWADSWKLFAEQPFTGFGYNATWNAFENRLSQYPNAPGPKYAHAHNTWLEWGLQLGASGVLLYAVFLAGLLVRAILIYRVGGDVQTCWQAICLLVYVEIYNLANVSSVPINRFGFFILAVTTACLCHRLYQVQIMDQESGDVAVAEASYGISQT